jgi:hypothetical protein
MLDPALIGTEYWSATVLVEAGAILRFADSVGDDGPRRRTGAALEAPLPFVLALVPFEAFSNLLGTNVRQIHASEFQIEQLRPVLAGTRLELRSRIIDAVRHGGALGPTEVVTIDDEGRDSATGETVYRARRVYAVLGAKEAA